MPRFYFDFYHGPDLILDQEGLELDDLKAAEHEVMRTALQLGRDRLPQNRHVKFVVRDDQRRPLTAVRLTLAVERLSATPRAAGDPMEPVPDTGGTNVSRRSLHRGSDRTCN